MGRWQAVGEIQIRALLREGYEDTGGLINAFTCVARSGPGAPQNAAAASLLCDRSPVPAAWSGQAAECGCAGSSGAGSSGKDSSAR
jgi:hypothetical protein